MIKKCILCGKNYEVKRICNFRTSKLCSRECRIEYYLIRYNKSGDFTKRFKYRQGKIIRATMNLDNKQWQMCAGTLLGDASMDTTCTGSCNLRFQHCEKQLDYLEWKKTIINNFIVREKPTICNPTGFSKKKSYLYQTVTHQDFTNFNNLFYIKKGKKREKIINPKILERLDIFGVLIWYLDDGCVAPSAKGRSAIRIHTNNFYKKEQKLLVNFFKHKYNITPKIYYLKSQDNYILSIGANDSEKLMKLFKPFLSQVPQCMHYKFF